MALLGETVREKLSQAISRYGEALSISDGTTTRSVPAQVAIMDVSTRLRLFKGAETETFSHPLLSVRVAGDDAIVAVGHTFVRAGRTWTVRKIVQPKLGGVIVATVLLCS